MMTIVFDAYGTLFDVAGAARQAASEPSGAALVPVWPGLSEDWRRKQLEYTWLRAITGTHADFARVTADALDWAMEAARLNDPEMRARLLALYDRLPCYPEVPSVLSALRKKGTRLAILSNGTPAMLASAVASAGLESCLDAVLSVEAVQIYKPHHRVYDLVRDRLGADPGTVLFVSSNGWDVAGAGQYGFTTLWVNRSGMPQDRMPATPAHTARDLTWLLTFPGLP